MKRFIKALLFNNDKQKGDAQEVERKFFFEGTQQEKSVAMWVAKKLGVKVYFGKCKEPYVTDELEYVKITNYIIDNKLEGWWNYNIIREYHAIKTGY